MKNNWLSILLTQLGERRAELYLAAMLLWLLPALALLVLGVAWLWQNGWVLWFSGSLFLLALLTLGGRWLLRPGKEGTPAPDAAVTHLAPRLEWAAEDETVWESARQRVVQLDLAAVAWEDMPALAMEQLFFVAHCYHADDAEAEILQPLTVLVLGQVNAGKSSLVNALRAGAVAEVDSLPSTDGFRRYPLQLANETELVLVDSPGLDGSEAASENLLAAAVQADLLLWVNAANKPAKALDHHFMLRWRDWCSANPRRLPPPLLLVTTHNDLLPPREEWDPPYDLTAEDDPKATAILDALEYIHEAIGFQAEEPALAIALPPVQPSWNIEVLQELLLEAAGQARSAQLNRERLHAQGGDGPVLSQLLAQARGLVHIGKQVLGGRR